MVTAAQRERHLDWLVQLTNIPTAAGREHRVIAWVEEWLRRRRNLAVKRDRHGNMLIEIVGAATAASGGGGGGRRRSAALAAGSPPVLFTAHLDHPAFVVREVVDARTVKVEFRGGVREAYFENAKVVVHDADDGRHAGRINHFAKGEHFIEATVRLAKPTDAIAVDDIATWDLKPSAVTRKGILRAPACDDLAAAAAALSALDVLRGMDGVGDVRVLLTRAEEVGFVGAILACEDGLIPHDAKVIALENSRSFAESPIGAGPIIRVGDRISIFHHGLTYAITQLADALAQSEAKTAPGAGGGWARGPGFGGAAAEPGGFRWQRKLMAGGACEATCFQAYGLEATCLCLPLGNYHNMGDIDAVMAGANSKPAKVDSEFISVSDYHHLVRLLVECGVKMTGKGLTAEAADGAAAIRRRMAEIRDSRSFVLTERAAKVK